MSFVSMLTGIIGWFFLGEKLTGMNVLAMLISMSGIVVAISNRKLRLNYSAKGLLLAFGGATGQAVGLILSKKGVGNCDPIAETQIRALFGLLSFGIKMSVLHRWKTLLLHLRIKVVSELFPLERFSACLLVSHCHYLRYSILKRVLLQA